MTKIVGRDLKEGTQVSFNNITDASRYLNLDSSHIRKCLNGRRTSHGGYSWKIDNSDESNMWTTIEDNLIIKHYPSGKLADLLISTQKDIASINARAKELGVKRNRVISSDNRSELDLVNYVIESDERV